MAIFWRKESNAIIEDYLEKKKQGKQSLTSRKNILLFDQLIHRMETNDSGAIESFREWIKNGKISSTKELFEGGREEVLVYMLGEEYAAKYVKWLEKMVSFPYTQGYSRRPLRTSDVGLHYVKALDRLQDFFTIAASGLSLETLLKGGTNESERIFIGDINYSALVCVEIDEGNTQIIEQIKEILCSENNHSGIVTYHLLEGIVMSRNRDLYEWEGKLLLAAKLQEGLRQSIAETMDSGRAEAFTYLFDIIKSNDLQRFSSIKRAIGTWTGLVDESNADRITQKVVELIAGVLADPACREKYLQSEDVIEVYMGLWIAGFYQMEEIEPLAINILREGVKHKIQTMFYYLKATQSDEFQCRMAKQALEVYGDDISLVAAFIDCYLPGHGLNSYYSDKEYYTGFFESRKEAEKHYALLKNLQERVKAKEVFSPFIFPWYSVELTKQQIIDKMALLVYIAGNNIRLVDDACGYFTQMSSSTRRNFIRLVLDKPSTSIQRETLTKALGDRAEYPRDEAFTVLDKLDLKKEEFLMIEDMLRFKTGNLRQNAIKLLMKQKPAELEKTIKRLLKDSLADKRTAGLDMLLKIRTEEEYAPAYKRSLKYVAEIAAPTMKEQVLIDQLTPREDAVIYNAANGFGLYDPRGEVVLPQLTVEDDFDRKEVFSLFYEGSFLKRMIGKTKKDALTILSKLSELVAAHADEQFTGRYDYQFLLGNYFDMVKKEEEESCLLNRYPYPDLWRGFYQEEVHDFKTLFQLYFLCSVEWGQEEYVHEFNQQMNKKFLPEICAFYGFDLSGLKKEVQALPYIKVVRSIIQVLVREYWDKEYACKVWRNMLLSFYPYMNKKEARMIFAYNNWSKEEYKQTWFIHQHDAIGFWFNDIFSEDNEEHFEEYFTIMYMYYKKVDFFQVDPIAAETSLLNIFEFAKAYMAGLIPEEEVIKELMVRVNAGEQLAEASSFFVGNMAAWRLKKMKIKENADFSGLKQILKKVTDRILDIELKRGDSATVVSPLAMKLQRVEGASTLIGILKAFGKDTFGRSDYYYGSDYTKKDVLSRLLRCCFPAEGETAETLARLLEGTGIKEERLVEAGMYAPQWLEIIEQCIGWKGLYSAGYYFQAHLNEGCDDRKKAIIARFTPIDVEDLKAGAFDIEWFREAYNEIGEKRFAVVYDAAKYISSGAGHTRARKYADAVNGKLDQVETRKTIAEKRNKDLLMAYCLIPLNKKNNKDLLERYQYLQQFLKESKTFGTQRQESEKNAVTIGMQNLARNAGYADVTRLTWSMETALIKEIKSYFVPKEREGVATYIHIDDEGKSAICYIKEGKALNSAPAKLKKDPYIAELKEVHKKLKAQYSRSRLMLEQAMEDETLFLVRELEELTQNPVVWPLLRHLVFINKKGETGFYSEKSLVTPDGEILLQKPAVEVRIAHPIDLYRKGNWAAYQRYLFDRQWRQPFKQVFRELYVKTEEELSLPHSLRYAGYQIQPQKTVAVLKGRRWVANYEEGLQKVYYKENIVASIYALADWFSPADAEAPTLEWVAFHDRKTFKSLLVKDIPEVLFSEVMRDVDLAVSVAHVGGVDPETSHSTIEMRRAIIELTLPLFKLNNVRLEKNFALITGTRGNYNIHLGSGVIHQEAGTMIHVLPVHSQHRGRLFLPFVDDDPKTAEILSKIILFAEDQKIKDPFILDQIKR